MVGQLGSFLFLQSKKITGNFLGIIHLKWEGNRKESGKMCRMVEHVHEHTLFGV